MFMLGNKATAQTILKKLFEKGDSLAGIWLAALELQNHNPKVP